MRTRYAVSLTIAREFDADGWDAWRMFRIAADVQREQGSCDLVYRWHDEDVVRTRHTLRTVFEVVPRA